VFEIEVKIMAVVESYNMGVTPIRTWLVGENIRPSMLQFATGFFYQHTVQQMKREAYLITNRHVAIDEERSLYPNVFKILIHNSIDMLRSVREVEIPLYDENMNPLWYEHPHIKDADIVALNIDEYIRAGDVIQYWSKDDFPSQGQIIAFGSRVSIIGYPLAFYDDVHNFPIARSGTIASPYGVAFKNQPYFLVDATLHEGTSGSPVIIPRSGVRPKVKTVFHTLLGIHSGGWKVDDIELGLGIVWYPDLIQEIVSDKKYGSIRV